MGGVIVIINSTSTPAGIYLRWRNKNNEIISKTISCDEFQPKFYIKQDATEMLTCRGRDKHGAFDLKPKFCKTEFTNLEGEPLKEVTWKPAKPQYSRILKNWFNKHNIDTYEADVPYHFRYAVEEIKEIPEYKMRKWYWDMEWMSEESEYEGAITCIVRYDNYLDTYKTYWWHPTDWTAATVREKTLPYASEKKMLQAFLKDIIHYDPDMLISWFGWKFDLPKLIKRLLHNKLDAQLLSPCDEVSGVFWDGKKITMDEKKVNSYSPTFQPIKGRICVPLDEAFERQWLDAQKGTLPSMALDYIAETVLGKKKLTSEKFPDKNDFFAKGWLEDTEHYLAYAKVDVELLVELDDKNHTTDAILSLQRLLMAPFDACFHATKMASIYFMRNASWKAPTGKRDVLRSYDGAMVYDPLSEGTNGLHLGVAAFDFASLYPSMMIARNISWETKSDVPTEFAVNVKTPKDFSEIVEKDMRYFKTDKLGLLPTSLLGLKKLRDEYKQNRDGAKTPEEYSKWNNNQMAVKRLMASFYGIVGFQGFGWCDIGLAECITASAREAIREAARLVEEI